MPSYSILAKPGSPQVDMSQIHDTQSRRLLNHVANVIWPTSMAEIVSNILVLDVEAANESALRQFCEQSGIVGTTPSVSSEIGALAILEAHSEFGGVFVAEDYLGTQEKTLQLVRKIRAARPELPLFLRRASSNRGLTGLSLDDAAMFVQCYTVSDLHNLRVGLEESIFRRLYPNELARGIRELTKNSLEGLFKGCQVTSEAPYLSSERMMPGEFFTLIGINTEWCSGYMTILGPELPLLEVLGHVECLNGGAQLDFRALNNYISEATNVVWGSFRNRYVRVESPPSSIQVPIVVNHRHRFISFGSDDPQLCFKYVIRPANAGPDAPCAWLYQRFVFNLSWNPDKFRAFQSTEPEVVWTSGELEEF